jgi:membrane protein YdbS with pleckstrin-like domain
MNVESVLTTLSIVISSLILAIGIWLLAGWYLEDLWPASTRYPLGGVMALYAFYRIATARSRFRRKDEGDETEDDAG